MRGSLPVLSVVAVPAVLLVSLTPTFPARANQTVEHDPAPAAEPELQPVLLTDFTDPALNARWAVVNDNVMGGRSRGEFVIRDGALLFSGSTNTNGGGFSSIRSRSEALNLSEFDGIQLELEGDGRRYTWRLATGSSWRGIPVGYWAEFDTSAGESQTIRLPFDAFYPQAYGRKLQGLNIDLTRVNGMGIMIYDGQDGPFALRLKSVSAYRTPSK